ncbi:MAG: carbohydrate ABC transporter permease, partial [Candidatus Dormibacteraceae bacterium]
MEGTSVMPEAARRTGRSWLVAREYATGILFLAPSLILFAIFILWPIVESVWYSLHANNIIGQATLFVGLEQYVTYFQQSGTWQILGNTLYFAAATVIPTIVLALGISALLTQKLRGIGVFRTLIATPFAFSSATAAVVFATFFSPGVGIFDGFLQELHLTPVHWLTSPNLAMPSVAGMSVWLLLGYDVLVLTAGFGGIPDDVMEASSLD